MLLSAPLAWGCGIVGPSCLSRQERGTVAVIRGEVAAGQTVSHIVVYGTQGSQNDVNVSWPNMSSPDGPRIAVYGTRVECTDLGLRSSAQRGDACEVLGRAGWSDGHLVTSFAIPNGRGNPDILGSPAQFKVWLVGDEERSATYTLDVTFFYGPDC
jgi:hypothetical protein